MPQPPSRKTSRADALLWAVEAEECRRSLKTFLKSVWHIFEPREFADGWVVDCLVSHLESVTRGDIRYLLINVPPRHSKSSIVSVVWPIWGWINNPSEQFLCSSFNLNLAIRDNTRKRRIIEDTWFHNRFPDIQLSEEQNLKQYFTNTKNGHQQITSVNGSTTGLGGSVLICDDPHNVDEAYSDAERQSAVIWFRESWSNRMNNPAKDRMVVVGQRIHEDDVSGYILKERPDWDALILPAFYEPARKCFTSIGWEDPRKVEGDLLWPERFSHASLEGLRRDLGSTGFSSQYQQSPVPAGGGQFKEKWMRYFSLEQDFYVLHNPDGNKRIPIKDCWKFMVVDLAISLKTDADYTVIQCWAVTKDRDILLIDQFRDRLDNPAQQQAIKSMYYQHKPNFVQIENVAYQLAIIQQLLRDAIPCREYKPVRDKISRASTAAVIMEQGKMYFRAMAPWLDVLKAELLHFPKASHDDTVDTTSMAADTITSYDDPHFHIAALQQRLAIVKNRANVPTEGVMSNGVLPI